MTRLDAKTAEVPRSGLSGRWARWPTALRLVAILALVLLPLGIVAAFASADAAADARAQRRALVEAHVRSEAEAISGLLASVRLALMDVGSRPASNEPDPCKRAAAGLGRAGVDGPVRIVRRGRLICEGRGDALRVVDGPAPPTPAVRDTVELDGDNERIVVRVVKADGWAEGAITRARLRELVRNEDSSLNSFLVGGTRTFPIADDYAPSALQRTVSFRRAVPGSDFVLQARGGAYPLRATEILSILLPILMWLAASLAAWLVADRLLLRPIVKLRDAVRAWRPGETELTIPSLMTPASEIRELGDAFRANADAIAAREADIERGAGRQMRLVREVHHRVKNNLQVVASLLNLHARGAKTPDAAAAYASILRRVDALAVVHRNHYAELEDNRGLALRTLLSELAANLRGNPAPGSERMGIGIEADPVHATQDVAVSVAFLVTEIVEFAMLCAPHAPVEISLRRSPANPATARLVINAKGLVDAPPCEHVDERQFERVTTGLARQLRSQLDRTEDRAGFALDIPVLDD